MTSLAGRLAGAAGWRRALYLVVLGAIATLAMAPVHFTPALLVAFTGFAWTLDGSPRLWKAALDGFWFGLGMYVSGLYWVANALLTDVGQFWWLLPFAILALPALMALFAGLAGALAYLMWRPDSGSRVMALAVAWTAGEWLRGHLFTGFPWNLVGYTWAWSDDMLQVTALVGIHGLSFLTVLAATAPAALVGAGASRWYLQIVAFAFIAIGFAFGLARLGNADDRTVNARVRIVQANIPQVFKWEPDQLRANLERHLVLTRSTGIDAADVVVWSETAMPYPIHDDAELRAALGGLVRPGAVFVTGVTRLRFDASSRYVEQVWNSVAMLDSSGAILGSYDKAHLVPFGEYVPLRPILSRLGLEKVVPGMLDFSAGQGPRTIALPGLPPVSPLVCYEVIFPGAVVANGERAGWLLNVTNDAWYGNSAGPYQHFAMARVRATEEGLPLVRAANTGISAVIDGYGRVHARLGLGQGGVLDAALPVALPPTLYARVRDWPVLAALFLLAIVLLPTAFIARRVRASATVRDIEQAW